MIKLFSSCFFSVHSMNITQTGIGLVWLIRSIYLFLQMSSYLVCWWWDQSGISNWKSHISNDPDYIVTHTATWQDRLPATSSYDLPLTLFSTFLHTSQFFDLFTSRSEGSLMHFWAICIILTLTINRLKKIIFLFAASFDNYQRTMPSPRCYIWLEPRPQSPWQHKTLAVL